VITSWSAWLSARIIIAALLVAIGTTAAPAENDDDGARPVTIGVVGDMPYTTQQQTAFQAFIDAMSADTSFRLLVHLGDIKSGSSACTDGYITGIRNQFNTYAGALVYTPGDNEWTDCHRNASQPKNPVERLNFLRAQFFSQPGRTLGGESVQVLTQASKSSAFPTFVENQAWVTSKVVFGVVNLPGSNNDLDPWTNGVGTPAQQQEEFASRLAADLEWLDAIFALADESHARAVVIGIQADMWDPAAGAAELTGYNQIIQKLAFLVRQFGKPVLLLNGDSHNFLVDNPLAAGDPAHGVTDPVPNLTRIIVQGGSDHFPLQYLRLTIDPRPSHPTFSWERVTP